MPSSKFWHRFQVTSSLPCLSLIPILEQLERSNSEKFLENSNIKHKTFSSSLNFSEYFCCMKKFIWFGNKILATLPSVCATACQIKFQGKMEEKTWCFGFDAGCFFLIIEGSQFGHPSQSLHDLGLHKENFFSYMRDEFSSLRSTKTLELQSLGLVSE